MPLSSIADRETPSTSTGVAFLCHPYHRGGVTRWMVDAAAELRRRGTPVWFVAPEPRIPFVSGADRPTVASLVRELPSDCRPALVTSSVGLAFELGSRAHRRAVYANAVVSGVPPGTPCIPSDDADAWAAAAELGGSYPMIGVLHADDRMYYDLARTYRSELAACVAVSRRIANTAAQETGRAVESIPCGVPIRVCVNGSQASREYARIVWIGRMEETQKRVSDLPRIAAGLRERQVPFSFALIGDGPQRRDVEAQIERAKLGDSVQLLGWLGAERIWQHLCDADVLLLPSNYEGMPVVVMEALSAGCAVVASHVSGVEDVAATGDGGRVVSTHPIGDTEQAVTHIVRVLGMPREDRRRLARALAMQLFSIEVCVDRYQQILTTFQRGATPARSRSTAALLSGALSLPLVLARSARRALSTSGGSR